MAGAGVLAVSGSGLLIAAVANAQTPPGTITFSPATGTDTVIVNGTTSGPCDVGATDPNTPTNAYDVVVTGPGAFAPNPGAARPDGVSVRGQTPNGFSTTQPITFGIRINFHDLAQELGQPLPPGDYVFTFRCDSDFGPTGQTYRGTIAFTGGPPATTYTSADNPPPASSSPSPSPSPNPSSSPSPSPSPSPSSSPSPTPMESPTSTPTTTPDSATTTPATSTSDAAGATTSTDPGGEANPLASTDTLAKTGAPIALIFLGGLILLAAGLALVVWSKRPNSRSNHRKP